MCCVKGILLATLLAAGAAVVADAGSAVAVKVEYGGGGFVCGIETAAYGDIFLYGHGMINSVGWWGRVVLAGIEHEAQYLRLVEQGIVDLLGHGEAIVAPGWGASTGAWVALLSKLYTNTLQDSVLKVPLYKFCEIGYYLLRVSIIY
jgi:hypothetical protein